MALKSLKGGSNTSGNLCLIARVWRATLDMDSFHLRRGVSRYATSNLFIPQVRDSLIPFKWKIGMFLYATNKGFSSTEAEVLLLSAPVQASCVPEGKKKENLVVKSVFCVFVCMSHLWISTCRSHSHFKLKCQARLCEMWTAFCTEEVCEGSTDPDRSFVLGWPTTNCVANFR